jgi:hypothetical protein
MGSGKGKTRRVQSGVAELSEAMRAEAVTAREKWNQFVQDSGIQKVKLFRYYLDKDEAARLSDADYEQLMRELLADIIAAGVVTAPDTSSADDIVFKMVDGNQVVTGGTIGAGTDFRNCMTVALKSSPEKAIAMFMPRYHFGKPTVMGDLIVQKAVEATSRSILRLTSPG